MKQEIEFHLEGLREEGFEVPSPSSYTTGNLTPGHYMAIL